MLMRCNLVLVSENRIIDAVLILTRMQEKYCTKGKKLHMCLVDVERAVREYHRKCWNRQ